MTNRQRLLAKYRAFRETSRILGRKKYSLNDIFKEVDTSKVIAFEESVVFEDLKKGYYQ